MRKPSVRLTLLCLLAGGLIAGAIAIWSTTSLGECQFHFASGACADEMPLWRDRLALELLIAGSGVLVVVAAVSSIKFMRTPLRLPVIVAQRASVGIVQYTHTFPGRLFLGSLVAAVAVGGATVIFSIRDIPNDGLRLRDYSVAQYWRPPWVVPLTVVVLIAGIGGGIAIAASGLRYRSKK